MDTSGFAKNRKRNLHQNEKAGRNYRGFGRVEGAIDAKLDLARGHAMTLDDFRRSLTANEPPAGLTLALAGLWWDAKGDWTRAA